MRVAVELTIDTGRRPDELCHLHLDCLDRDQDGKPVLVYDNIKAHRKAAGCPSRRRPRAVITCSSSVSVNGSQRAHRSAQALALAVSQSPRPTIDHRGRDDLSASRMGTCLAGRVRATVIEIDGTPTTKMLPFDKKKIFPMPTGTPTHSDTPTPASLSDVLRDLMNHRQLSQLSSTIA